MTLRWNTSSFCAVDWNVDRKYPFNIFFVNFQTYISSKVNILNSSDKVFVEMFMRIMGLFVKGICFICLDYGLCSSSIVGMHFKLFWNFNKRHLTMTIAAFDSLQFALFPSSRPILQI